ncbi:MAG TPA: zinc-binding dehydrogenase [Xanthobacteraceae bacterium]
MAKVPRWLSIRWPDRASRDSSRQPRPAARWSSTVRGFGLPSTTRDDAKLTALKTFIGKGLAAGDFKPTIAKLFRFEEIADAHRYLEAGEQIGKIVVTV